MKYRIRKEGWFPPPSQVQHERHWFVLTDTHGPIGTIGRVARRQRPWRPVKREGLKRPR